MKIDSIRSMTQDELQDELLKLKKEQFNLRFQQASGQLEKTARMRSVRRDIARVKTILSKGQKKRKIRRKPMPKRVLQGVVTSSKGEKNRCC